VKRIVALVGMCGSGKSIVNDYFKALGYTSVYFGGITMDELQKRGLEVTPSNEKMVREGLRKQYGPGAFAILNLPKIEAVLANGNVIIDGLYSWSEYKILKEKFGDDLVVISVYAPPKIRYERLSSRPVRPIASDEAKQRDYAEIENIEKGGPIAMADYTLLNDKDLDSLKEQLKALQKNIP